MPTTDPDTEFQLVMVNAGKTYIGTRLVQVWVANTQSAQSVGPAIQPPSVGPILVLTYTNHALDQFLLDLVQKCSFEPGIGGLVRIGSQSKAEALQPYNLFDLAKNTSSQLRRHTAGVALRYVSALPESDTKLPKMHFVTATQKALMVISSRLANMSALLRR